MPGSMKKSCQKCRRVFTGEKMNRKNILLFCVITEISLIAFIAVACKFEDFKFYLFYNFLYGIVVSLSVPLLLLYKEKQNLDAVGIKKPSRFQMLIMAAFVVFSIGGQIIPKIAAREHIAWEVLPIAILPLIMTTFFEEFLFRGFMQTRLEKCFGTIPAIIVSGLLFSFYHLSYPGFRTASDLLLLFAVGVGFASAFKLSGNNLLVSFFVNLPNAFVTYALKYWQFPKMTAASALYAGITILIICVIIYNYAKAFKINWRFSRKGVLNEK